MDESVHGILLTILIDSVICLILLLLFYKFRTKRAAPSSSEGPEAFLKRAYINEKSLPFSSILHKLHEINDQELIENLGRFPLDYISFNRLSYTTVTIIGILGVSILIPLYSIGNDNVKNDMDSIGISHAITQEDLLATPVLFVVLFSVCLYYFIYRYAKVCLSKGNKGEVINKQIKPISEFTVWVWGLPKNRSAAHIQQEFDRIVYMHASPDSIEFTYVVPNYTQAYQQHLKILHYENSLTYHTQYEQM